MLRMARRPGVVVLSSTWSLATLTVPANDVASSSLMGAIIRQGPHLGARQSFCLLMHEARPPRLLRAVPPSLLSLPSASLPA